MDVNEHDTVSNVTLRHKLKYKNSAFTVILHFTVTVESSTLSTTHTMLIFIVSIKQFDNYNICIFSSTLVYQRQKIHIAYQRDGRDVLVIGLPADKYVLYFISVEYFIPFLLIFFLFKFFLD